MFVQPIFSLGLRAALHNWASFSAQLPTSFVCLVAFNWIKISNENSRFKNKISNAFIDRINKIYFLNKLLIDTQDSDSSTFPQNFRFKLENFQVSEIAQLNLEFILQIVLFISYSTK